MQSKPNVCTNLRLTAKAFFKIILLVPTQSGLYFRVLLIKYKPLATYNVIARQKNWRAPESKQNLPSVSNEKFPQKFN